MLGASLKNTEKRREGENTYGGEDGDMRARPVVGRRVFFDAAPAVGDRDQIACFPVPALSAMDIGTYLSVLRRGWPWAGRGRGRAADVAAGDVEAEACCCCCCAWGATLLSVGRGEAREITIGHGVSMSGGREQDGDGDGRESF